jgi:tetratricopeptide (TPR) repeat protein
MRALSTLSPTVNTPIADPLIGRTIAQYEILARVGGGAMGVVYQARDTKLGRLVALKFLPQQWSHDETAKQRFVREAQAASATDHPNICTVHDIQTSADGQLFIVMAFYRGPTLKQRLENGPLPVHEALEIATQIADGLAKAHAQGVVHRDIKPGNVMVTDDGVRILDFGLATFADALKLTAENATFGTPAYMSPEQVRGQAADARSDVWAVGVVVYEMLTGHVPFQGSHAEAIAHAIRHEPPPPLRSVRPEVPEDVEQLVFRGLHKDPAVRFQSGRELSRALRQARGVTLSLSGPVSTPRLVSWPAGSRAVGRRLRRSAIAALAAVAVGLVTWSLWPVERVPVVVVPTVNLTGYQELNAFTLALSEELTGQLRDSAAVRVLPHERMLEIIRPFRETDRDVSSREALQAIAGQSRAQVLVVPTLLREGDAWKARVEFRNPDTGATERYETAPVISALMKDAFHGRLVPMLAVGVDEHFARGPRAFVGDRILAFAGLASRARRPRLTSADAAREFERGVDAYERGELSAARAAFAAAAARDSTNPLPLAWQSRVATLMRQDKEAAETAAQAQRLLTDDTGEIERLFIEAIGAETRRDAALAEARYQALIERHNDDPTWLIERAGFQDRQGRAVDAIATYHAALGLDDRQPRVHVELCRLYSPTRTNEPVLAKQHGERALTMYAALGNAAGQAQAHWCLTDVLRSGSDLERSDAKRHAEAALTLIERFDYAYGLGRAYNYLALVAWAGRNGPDALALWEKALTLTNQVGNALLGSRVLMNLGVVNELLGRRALALKYYTDSLALFEAAGHEQDAAWNQVNAASILIRFGENPDEGFRDTQNALAVFEKLGDKDFEVFARLTLATYYRNTGHWDDARRQLTLADTIARQHDLDSKITLVAVDLGRLHFDEGAYDEARSLFRSALVDASSDDRIQARIGLARTLIRVGDFEAARLELLSAANEIGHESDLGALASLYAAEGELAYETQTEAAMRSKFGLAAKLWTREYPDPASIEARAYLGLLDGLQGKPSGRTLLDDSEAQARRMGRIVLATRCQLLLARLDIRERRYGAALGRLNGVAPDTLGGLAPELRAQIHHWRSQALAGFGDRQKSAEESAAATQLIDQLRRRLPEADRDRVLLRPDIRLIHTRALVRQ